MNTFEPTIATTGSIETFARVWRSDQFPAGQLYWEFRQVEHPINKREHEANIRERWIAWSSLTKT